MNPKRQFRQLRNDDRWVGLPSTSPTQNHVGVTADRRPRGARLNTGLALVIAAAVVAGLWFGLNGVRSPSPAALSPLPTPTALPAGVVPVAGSCTDSARVQPIGCATYTGVAAAGVPGGTDSFTGAVPPTLTLRTTANSVTAFVQTGCNGLTGPVTITSSEIAFGNGTAMTGAACGGGRGAQDTWIAELFAHPVHYVIKGDVLTLTSGSRVLQLTSTGSTSARSSYDG